MNEDDNPQQTRLDGLKHLMTKPKDMLTLRRDLATEIGLNEAIVIQQMLYWNDINQSAKKQATHFFDGRWWVYNTWAEWRSDNFPFWSERTIKRTFDKLVKDGYIITKPHENNRKGQWFALDLTPDNLSPLDTATPDNLSPPQAIQKLTSTTENLEPKGSGETKKSSTPQTEVNKGAIAIIQVWLEENSAIVEGAYGNTGYRHHAKKLTEAGYTSDEVQAFIRHCKAEKFWQGRAVGWKHISENIGAWKAAGNPPAVSQNDALPTYTPELAAEQARIKQETEDIHRQWVANMLGEGS